MPITAYLGSTVGEYREKSYSLLLSLELFCSMHKDQRMMPHDRYPRVIRETNEQILIHRLICYKCKTTVAVLPDFLLPRKQYSRGEIEAVLMDAETTSVYDIDTEASVYTIRNWIKTLRLETDNHRFHITLQTN